MVERELLLGEEQVSSRQTGVTVQKRLNFWFDRGITPEFLQVFQKAIFLVVVMKSLLCEAKLRSHLIRVTTQKGSNFWSECWNVLKFLQ